jgi:Family of unknown function (DUF6088)
VESKDAHRQADRDTCALLGFGYRPVRRMLHISDMRLLPDILRDQLLARIEENPDEVWTPGDFADLGNRDVIDKTLQRLEKSKVLRRIDRGLYDKPHENKLTGSLSVPDYRAVIRAVARRDKARILMDGMTAANDLGFTEEAAPERTGRLQGLGVRVMAKTSTKPNEFVLRIKNRRLRRHLTDKAKKTGCTPETLVNSML